MASTILQARVYKKLQQAATVQVFTSKHRELDHYRDKLTPAGACLPWLFPNESRSRLLKCNTIVLSTSLEIHHPGRV